MKKNLTLGIGLVAVTVFVILLSIILSWNSTRKQLKKIKDQLDEFVSHSMLSSSSSSSRINTDTKKMEETNQDEKQIENENKEHQMLASGHLPIVSSVKETTTTSQSDSSTLLPMITNIETKINQLQSQQTLFSQDLEKISNLTSILSGAKISPLELSDSTKFIFYRLKCLDNKYYMQLYVNKEEDGIETPKSPEVHEVHEEQKIQEEEEPVLNIEHPELYIAPTPSSTPSIKLNLGLEPIVDISHAVPFYITKGYPDVTNYTDSSVRLCFVYKNITYVLDIDSQGKLIGVPMEEAKSDANMIISKPDKLSGQEGIYTIESQLRHRILDSFNSRIVDKEQLDILDRELLFTFDRVHMQ